MADAATVNRIEFAELVRRQYAGWIAAAFVIVGDRERAEEIVQEALSRTVRRWEEVGSLDRPGAWVRKVVVNEAISVWRSMQRESILLNRLAVLEVPAGNSTPEVDSDLWAAVRLLPEEQCRAIALFYGADASLAEVAEELGATVSSTKSLLFRARGRLRQLLGDEEATDER